MNSPTDQPGASSTAQEQAESRLARLGVQVLPLTGVTHMASQEAVAENLLLLQLDFLRTALARS